MTTFDLSKCKKFECSAEGGCLLIDLPSVDLLINNNFGDGSFMTYINEEPLEVHGDPSWIQLGAYFRLKTLGNVWKWDYNDPDNRVIATLSPGVWAAYTRDNDANEVAVLLLKLWDE